MKLTTQEWMNRAKDDLDVIEEIHDVAHLTNMVAFHAQQAIEKTFKALLEERDEEIPRIHNLVRLHHLVRDRLELELDELLLREINDVYIDGRYPGDIGLLPYGKPTTEDAARFAALARQVYEHSEKLLESEAQRGGNQEANDENE